MAGRQLLWVAVALFHVFPRSSESDAQRVGAIRELSSIRYRLDSCGSTGRLGPASYQQCINYHRNLSTPVYRDGLILQQTTPLFKGGQLVRIPRTTTYNLTVVGGAGGRGLCSSVYGRGVVVKAQAQLQERFPMLVLVGQRGMGPCEFTSPPIDSVCSSVSASDSSECNETWWNYLVNIARPVDGLDVYGHTGGGGGGGASMIRLENEGGLQDFPFIVAGGGGGGAALLALEILDSVNFTKPVNATREEIYQAFVDGKREIFDPFLSDRENQRGFVAPAGEKKTAGAGGGYTSGFEELRRVDGSQLIFEEEFAEGGTDCGTTSFFPTSFTDEVGGFGAGGGGCGGGGGGGGQTGGAIVGAGNLVPGGGGYSFSQNPAKITEYGWNDGDGYVEIVATDCGCAHRCRVFETEDQFQCVCPTYARLAPDFNDCFHPTTRDVQQSDLLRDTKSGLSLSLVDFGSSARLYSIATTLTSRSQSETGASGSGGSGGVVGGGYSNTKDEVLCALVFIGENNDLVLTSNIAQNGHNMLTMLSRIEVNFTAGSVVVAESADFLSSAVVITGALLVSLGDCFVEGHLKMNISILETIDNQVAGMSVTELILAHPEMATALLIRLLENDTDPTVPSDGAPTNFELTAWQIVSVGVATAVVLLALLGFAWLGMCYYRKKRKKRFITVQVPTSLVSSLTSNAMYVSHHDSVFPQSPYHKYSHNNRSQLEMSERYTGSARTGAESYSLKRQSGRVVWEGGVVLPPEHSFSTYNRSRSKSSLKHTEWQYPRNQLIYMRELGEGQFGKVLLMKAQRGIAGFQGDLPVAVKTLASRDTEMVTKFMEEAELMKTFSHLNIVSLLGVSTDDVLDDDNAPLMILEYMPYGDLHAFLINNKPGSGTLTVSLGEAHFVSFAADVAEALEYIADKRYVHRDIAARNCLVGTGLRIKISDFGLARRLNADSFYSVEGEGVLPIRTMAPEIFLTGQFTTSSDVWSYGVLLWEMVSYGAVPLPGLSSKDIADCAQMRKLYHAIPQECPQVLSTLICLCHSHYPDLRPTFTEILTQLNHCW